MILTFLFFTIPFTDLLVWIFFTLNFQDKLGDRVIFISSNDTEFPPESARSLFIFADPSVNLTEIVFKGGNV